MGESGRRALLQLELVGGPAQPGRHALEVGEPGSGGARVGRLPDPDPAEAEAPAQPDLRGARGGSVLGLLSPLSR